MIYYNVGQFFIFYISKMHSKSLENLRKQSLYSIKKKERNSMNILIINDCILTSLNTEQVK